MKRLIYIPLLLIGLAGCSAADSGSAEANQEAGLKYAQCMRENGVPDFEDPKLDENGELDGLGLPKGVDEETAEAAREKCAKHLPNGGEPERMNPEDIEKFQEYAKCMRENGLPDFPDPDADGRFRFEDGKAPDPDTPEVKAANEECDEHLPGGGGGFVHLGGDK
jgi:hypothetical protein